MSSNWIYGILDFLLSAILALAWPVTIFFIARMFRGPLLSLINAIKGSRIRETEARLESHLGALDRQADRGKLPSIPAIIDQSQEPMNKVAPSGHESLEQFSVDLRNQYLKLMLSAKSDTESLIAWAWNRIRLHLDELWASVIRENETPTKFSTLVEDLDHHDVLSQELVEIITGLNQLRTRAYFPVDSPEVNRRYASLAMRTEMALVELIKQQKANN